VVEAHMKQSDAVHLRSLLRPGDDGRCEEA